MGSSYHETSTVLNQAYTPGVGNCFISGITPGLFCVDDYYDDKGSVYIRFS